MISVIIPIKYDDNECSRLNGIGSRGVLFSRMASMRVKWHVLKAKNINSDSERKLN